MRTCLSVLRSLKTKNLANMSENLRSWKETTATDQEETSKESNSDDDVRCLVKIMNDKIDKLDADNKSRHAMLLNKLTLLETTTTRLTAELKDLKEGLDFPNEQVNTVKVTLSEKADVARVKDLEKKVEDLENRSKWNNIVIWNIPEGQKEICRVKSWLLIFSLITWD